jgi:hypothetical protein
LSGTASVFALKADQTSGVWTGNVAKAAIYTRGMPEAEAEDLLRAPWQTFATPRRRLYLLASGGAGNAPGATVSASVSFIPGAATVSAGDVPPLRFPQTDLPRDQRGGADAFDNQLGGELLTLDYFGFTAPSGGAGNAAGVTLTASTSLIAGAATGEASVGGVTVTATLSFIPGIASAGVSGNAPGATVTATTSIITGVATGAAQAAGATVSAASSLIAGAATGGAQAAGATVSAGTSIIAGAATGAAQAAGVTLTSALSFIAGIASAGATGNAPGATITAVTSLIGGAATGDAQAPGATVAASASLISGAASGAAVADGVVVSAALSFLPGAATGAVAVPGNAPGATMQAALVFLPGVAFGDGTIAPGTTLTVSASLIAGGASVILDPMLGGSKTAGRVASFGMRSKIKQPNRPKQSNTKRSVH